MIVAHKVARMVLVEHDTVVVLPTGVTFAARVLHVHTAQSTV